MKRLIGFILLALWGVAAPIGVTAAATGIRPDRVILMDLAWAGPVLVAVGERGAILASEDDGAHWAAIPVSTTRTLTAVAFATADLGVAVGHGGTVLRSENGGRAWIPVAVPDLGGESLLGVVAIASDRFIAHGAFGMMIESVDGGRSWVRRMVLDDGFDRHIYRIIGMSPRRWLLVGESGTLAVSDDDGAHWTALDSPYAGSFFGAVRTRDGAVLLYGMRGSVYRSANEGKSWERIETGTLSGFNNGLVLPDGRIALVGNGGVIAIGDADGRGFRLTGLGRSIGLSHLTVAPSGAAVAIGDAGVTRTETLAGLIRDARHD